MVPVDWAGEATTALVDTGGGQYTTAYGYQWWVTTSDGAPAYAALGSGGQVLEVVPSRDLVVVFQFVGAGGGLGRMLPLVDSQIAPAYKPDVRRPVEPDCSSSHRARSKRRQRPIGVHSSPPNPRHCAAKRAWGRRHCDASCGATVKSRGVA